MKYQGQDMIPFSFFFFEAAEEMMSQNARGFVCPLARKWQNQSHVKNTVFTVFNKAKC